MKLFKVLENINKIVLTAYDIEAEKEVEIHTPLPYEVGDVIYFNEEENEYLLVNGLLNILADQIFRELTNNGEKSYAELSDEDKAIFNDTKNQLEESMKNPLRLSKEDTLFFLTSRAAMREFEAEF